MEQFNRVLRGYNPEEVNKFIDQVIGRVETMVSEIKVKDARIASLEQEVASIREKGDRYEEMESNLKRALLVAEQASDQIKVNAYHERDMITEDAKKNANRIINEALLKAEKINRDTEILQRNVIIFKRRLRDIIEAQIEVIDEIDSVDL